MIRVSPHLHIEWVKDEAVILDQETGQIHYLNPSGATIFAYIAEYGFEEGLEQVSALYKGQPGFEEDLQRLLHHLQESNLLIDES